MKLNLVSEGCGSFGLAHQQIFICNGKEGWAMSRFKQGFLRMIELSLYGHGVLHFAELGFAVYEEAYITASLAGFGALTMILGALFLGRTHHH